MTVKKYHIIPATGEPGICVARIRCEYGAAADHYPSPKDARNAFEREMEREQATLDTVPKQDVTPIRAGTIYEKGGVKTAMLPPGEYFICDPYVVIGTYDQAGWNAWVDTVDQDMGWENYIDDPEDEEQTIVAANYGTSPIIASKTYFGTGLHWATEPPRRVPSDAGLMGALPIQVLTDLGIDPEVARRRRLGFTHTFTEPTEMYRAKNGNIHLGDVMIIVHNDTIPEQAYEALDKYDSEDSDYPENQARRELRKKTYTKVVQEYLDIQV